MPGIKQGSDRALTGTKEPTQQNILKTVIEGEITPERVLGRQRMQWRIMLEAYKELYTRGHGILSGHISVVPKDYRRKQTTKVYWYTIPRSQMLQFPSSLAPKGGTSEPS